MATRVCLHDLLHTSTMFVSRSRSWKPKWQKLSFIVLSDRLQLIIDRLIGLLIKWFTYRSICIAVYKLSIDEFLKLRQHILFPGKNIDYGLNYLQTRNRITLFVYMFSTNCFSEEMICNSFICRWVSSCVRDNITGLMNKMIFDGESSICMPSPANVPMTLTFDPMIL